MTNKAFAKHKIPYKKLPDGTVVPVIAHKFFETDLPFGLVTFKVRVLEWERSSARFPILKPLINCGFPILMPLIN